MQSEHEQTLVPSPTTCIQPVKKVGKNNTMTTTTAATKGKTQTKEKRKETSKETRARWRTGPVR